MAPEVLLDQYEKRRRRFLCDALEEHAVKLCVHPDQRVDGWKRSDQFWLWLFSSPGETVTADHVKEFLTEFGLVRLSWNYSVVADQIMALRHTDLCGAAAGISDLSRQLQSKVGKQNTSTASKIAFFAKPHEEVFLWDTNARRAACFRDWRRAGGTKPSSFEGAYISRGEHDCTSYWDACAQALQEERHCRDFQQSVGKFCEYLKGVGGPMAERALMRDTSFVERRFLDKLMFCEGEWLKDEIEQGN